MKNLGVAAIINKTTGRQFVFKSKYLVKKIENTRNQLNFGCHYNQDLQKDWDEYSPSNFKFEVIISNLSDEIELNDNYINYLSNVDFIYNKSANDLMKPLNCDIEILTKKLYDLSGKEFNTTSFDKKLNEYHLSADDGMKFKFEFKKQIDEGLINFHNFNDKYDAFFKEIADNKLIDSLEFILSELDFDTKIKNYGLDIKSKSKIMDNIKNKIYDGEITQKNEISNIIDPLIKNEYSDNLVKKEAYGKLYDLTGENRVKREYKYNLNTKGLSIETGLKIKLEVEKLIEKGEVTKLNVEDVLNILIDDEFNNKNESIHKIKQDLIEELNEMNFDNVLDDHCLHENTKYKIIDEITALIDKDEIKSLDEIEIKSYKLIKDYELEDVKKRLEDLDDNKLDLILRKNNLKKGLFSRKSSKINKIMSNVSVNIIKENLLLISGKLNPLFCENPNIKFCSQCGFQNDKYSEYCCECGSKLE